MAEATLAVDQPPANEFHELVKPFPGELLVLGTGSLVGSLFVEQLGPNSQIYGVDRKTNPYSHSVYLRGYQELDITNSSQMRAVFERTPGKYVIMFSAYTNVAQAEKDRPQDPNDREQLKQNVAYQVNVEGVRNAVDAAQATGKVLIFTSTDFVFDGKDGPYKEEDRSGRSDDLCWYGETKKLAEEVILNSAEKHLVLRISYPYRRGFGGKGDFGRDMLTKAATRNPDGSVTFNYPLFDDQVLTPTYIEDIAPAVVALAQNNCRGIYHLASSDVVTPFDFGCQVYKTAWGIKNPEELITRGKLAKILENPASIRKPLHGGLVVEKITHDTGFIPTSWKTGIARAYSNS